MHRLTLTIALLLFAAMAPAAAPLVPIAELDVPRYMGTWYEIARYPNRFQQKCVGQSRADYRLLPDGGVEVTNRCNLQGGELEVAVGLARQQGDAASARLKVRFAPAWLSFIPAVWGDYWVVDIDEDYRWAIVSEPGRDYLWLLARQPCLPEETLAGLLDRLRQRELSPERLIVMGRCDAADPVPASVR